MNIFWLDRNMRLCAMYHSNKHLVKMLCEHVQILCTVIHLRGESSLYTSRVYKKMHVKHPCVLWCNESKENWEALKRLTYFLNLEYRYRYNKTCNHKSYDVIMDKYAPKSLPSTGVTKFAQAMPEDYKNEDAIEAYRDYYRVKNDI